MKATITRIDGSSNISAVGYNPYTQVLEVVFKSGGTYEYLQVGEAQYLDFLDAMSKGRYFHTHIKGKYEFRRVR